MSNFLVEPVDLQTLHERAEDYRQRKLRYRRGIGKRMIPDYEPPEWPMRVPLIGSEPMRASQELIALYTGLCYNFSDIAERLGFTYMSVRQASWELAQRIPGDLTNQLKVCAWVRGASLDVLTGRLLKRGVLK